MILPSSGTQGGSTRRPVPPPTRKTGLIIWGALLAGLVTFAAIAAVVGPSMQQRAGEDLANILGPLACFLSVANLVASIIIPRMGRPMAEAPPDAVALARIVIAAAVNEGAGLFAVVSWMVTGSPWAFPALAVSLGGLLRAFPSEARWKREGTAAAAPERERNRLVR